MGSSINNYLIDWFYDYQFILLTSLIQTVSYWHQYEPMLVHYKWWRIINSQSVRIQKDVHVLCITQCHNMLF